MSKQFRVSVDGNEYAGSQIAHLKDELAQISASLKTVERNFGLEDPHFAPFPPNAADDAKLVREMISARRRRARFFPSDMFADPAWDILLELYAAELEQQRIMVSTLCAAASVPATTALRWITALIERGMLSRTPDKLDRRRVYVQLTPMGSEGMRFYFNRQGAP